MEIFHANFGNPAHGRAIVRLIESYAPGRLPSEVRARLPADLAQHPAAVVLLAGSDEQIMGVAVCFLGYSTFAARPLLNVHDLVVDPEFRGRGIGTRLLDAVDREARRRGCCRITLEVQADNHRARALYQRLGFRGVDVDVHGKATLFAIKEL